MDFNTRDRIIAGIINREEDIIQWLYVRVYGYLESFILRRGGTAWDVMDVYQDGLLTLYEMAKDPSVFPEVNLPGYLFGICRYLWYKQYRKKQFLVPVQDVNSQDLMAFRDSDFPVFSDRRELKYILYLRHFEYLDSACRQLLTLYRRGIRVDDIVREMNLSSRSYAYKKKFKCMRQLIRYIRSDPEYVYI